MERCLMSEPYIPVQWVSLERAKDVAADVAAMLDEDAETVLADMRSPDRVVMLGGARVRVRE